MHLVSEMSAKATRDHFVPQAYLRAWGDDIHGGRLHVYRKRTGRHSMEKTSQVCVERSGDLNKYYRDPSVLRDYLAFLEPRWPSARASIVAGEVDPDAYFVAAGIAAYLLTCGPTARRLSTAHLTASLEAMRPMFAKQALQDGAISPNEASEIAKGLLDSDSIEIEVDPEYARAIHIKGLIPTQWRLFAGRWHLRHCTDGLSFVTSDNPIGRYDFTPDVSQIVLHFPITPNHTLLVKPDANRFLIEDAANAPPFGGVHTDTIGQSGAELLNSLVAASSEDVIISKSKTNWVNDLLLRYRSYRMEADSSIIPTGNGHYQVFNNRPREKETGRMWEPPHLVEKIRTLKK